MKRSIILVAAIGLASVFAMPAVAQMDDTGVNAGPDVASGSRIARRPAAPKPKPAPETSSTSTATPAEPAPQPQANPAPTP